MNNLVILNCADILAKNTEQSPLILGNSSYMYISLQFVPDTSDILIALGNFCFGFMNTCVYDCATSRSRGYKTFFMLNSAELKIYPDHIC